MPGSDLLWIVIGVDGWPRAARPLHGRHGVPVQFLPAHNALAEAAVTTARTLDYDGVPVRVIDPEHLVALAFQAGGHKRRERAWQMLDDGP